MSPNNRFLTSFGMTKLRGYNSGFGHISPDEIQRIGKPETAFPSLRPIAVIPNPIFIRGGISNFNFHCF